MRKKLLIVTTVPETLSIILRGQPSYLSSYFDTGIATSNGEHLLKIASQENFTIWGKSPPTVSSCHKPIQISNDTSIDMLVQSQSDFNFHQFCHIVNMHRGISPFKDLKSIWRMMQVIRMHKPDIVHSYTPKAGLVAMLAAFLCKTHIRIHTFTGLIFPTTANWVKRNLLKAIDRLICFCATQVVAEGQGVKKDLLKNHITQKPISIIGNGNIAGIDTDYYDPSLPDITKAGHELLTSFSGSLSGSLAIPLAASDSTSNFSSLSLPHDLALNNFVFLYLGRLNRDKGIKELVQAFTQLPDNACLLLAGDLDLTAPPDDETLHIINDHPRIHTLGFVQDIRGVMRACDVVVLPSYREGFPNVLLQAGAMQKPAIATNINGCNEIIVNEQTGWLLPPKDALALKQAMQTSMQTSKETRESMGMAARQRIKRLYERQPYLEILVKFYNDQLDLKLNHEKTV